MYLDSNICYFHLSIRKSEFENVAEKVRLFNSGNKVNIRIPRERKAFLYKKSHQYHI